MEKEYQLVELFSVQCNLVDNQYQQKSEVLYNFTPNKSYVYFLNVEASNLLFSWKRMILSLIKLS